MATSKKRAARRADSDTATATRSTPPQHTAGGKKEAVSFAPIPLRAIGDKRLTRTHFAALAAVAYHDRLSNHRKAGQGCWAGNQRLASMASINYTNLSTALSELVSWGYLAESRHPLNKRTKVFRVIYDDTSDSLPATHHGQLANLPTGKVIVAAIGHFNLPQLEIRPQMVCPGKSNSLANQQASTVEYIPLKRIEEIALKQIGTVADGSAVGFASAVGSRPMSAPNPKATLALIEQGMAAGGVLDDQTKGVVRAILAAAVPGDPLRDRAIRILEMYDKAIS